VDIQESWLLLSLAPDFHYTLCFVAVVSAFVDYLAFTGWQVPTLHSPHTTPNFSTHIQSKLISAYLNVKYLVGICLEHCPKVKELETKLYICVMSLNYNFS